MVKCTHRFSFWNTKVGRKKLSTVCWMNNKYVLVLLNNFIVHAYVHERPSFNHTWLITAFYVKANHYSLIFFSCIIQQRSLPLWNEPHHHSVVHREYTPLNTCTVCPIKYAHDFVMLSFVVVMLSGLCVLRCTSEDTKRKVGIPILYHGPI